MEKDGGCACGAIRFKVSEDFAAIAACHCSDCQKATGGGPNYVALIPSTALSVLSGRPRIYTKKADSGADVGRAFCADCGTPLWSILAHEPSIAIKVGTFDDRSELAPQLHVYVDSAPPWHAISDDLPAFPKMPPSI